MRLTDIFRLVLAGFKAYKLRITLTVMGVSIGIGAILFLLSLGYGLERLTKQRLQNVEDLSTLTVTTTSQLLTINDETVKKISNLKGVEKVEPVIQKSAQVTVGTVTTDAVVLGKGFYPSDKNKATISKNMLDLFGIKADQAVGKEIKLKIFVETQINGVNVLQPKGPFDFHIEAVSNDSQEERVVSLGLEHLRKISPSSYNYLRVTARSQDLVSSIKAQIEGFGYSVSSLAESLEQIKSVFYFIKLGLAGFGLIAMVVASIGMFNTLTISLLERTREIGIMKALGATNRDIRSLFLVEGVVLGVMGALFGSGLSLTLSFIVNFVVKSLATAAGADPVDLFYTPIEFLGLALVLSALTGFLTGLYPAHRAVKISPVDALRYE